MAIEAIRRTRSFGEKCGVIGAYGKDFEAARLIHPGLFTLQHRGQESAGIASADGTRLRIHKDMGLVAFVFDPRGFELEALPGHMAIGHVRYSTSQGSTVEHAQPVLRKDRQLSLVHNGNLPSTTLLEEFLQDVGVPINGSNDSEMMADALRYNVQRGATIEEAIIDTYPLFTGAFSLLVMTRDKLVAVRDPKGIRPLSIGTFNGGYVVASETCALKTLRAKYVDDVKPGEMVVIGENGMHRHTITQGQQQLDIFELVYFARPDSMLLGQTVYEVRKRLGENLAREAPVAADMIVPVPLSAIPAALGYAHQSRIPLELGLTKNPYIHRTFISPEQHLRDHDVDLKLNPLDTVLAGRRVVLIDDSIVRGTTSARIFRMVRDAGAREVHFRVTAPPVLYPDFYGIDTPDQSRLIAARMDLEQIREHIGADSLEYLSYEGLIAATELPEEVFSTSCFTGIYPIDIRERRSQIRNVVFKR